MINTQIQSYYFFEGDCAYFIEKEGIIQNRLAGQNQSDYSRAKGVAKPFAPAAIQMDDSLLIFAKMVAIEDSWWLKTRSFRSFQISQVTRSAKLLEALKGMSGIAVMLAYHSKGVALCIHSVEVGLPYPKCHMCPNPSGCSDSQK
jgi:hypothetical protein